MAIDNNKNINNTNNTSQLIYNMIKKRNDFYYKNLRHMIVILLIGILCLLCLFITSYYLAKGVKTASYIQVNLDGTVIKSENLQSTKSDNLIITDEYVINWVQKNISLIYSFDFSSRKSSFRNMVGLFTPAGLQVYQNAINQKKIFDTIDLNKYTVQAYGCGDDTVKVLSSGVNYVENYPIYTWSLSMPMVIRQVAVGAAESYKANLIVRVQRVPRVTAPEGIAIYSFLVDRVQGYSGDADSNKLCEAFFNTNSNTDKVKATTETKKNIENNK